MLFTIVAQLGLTSGAAYFGGKTVQPVIPELGNILE